MIAIVQEDEVKRAIWRHRAAPSPIFHTLGRLWVGAEQTGDVPPEERRSNSCSLLSADTIRRGILCLA
jgi:hypothetical protein